MPVVGSDPNKMDKTQVDTDSILTANDDNKVASQKAIKTYVDTRQRKAWVSGVLKSGAFLYMSKATTSSGSATFWLTTTGDSSGSAVFNTIYSDTISVVMYGSTASYQAYNPVVSGDNKSITVSVNQTTSVLLGLLQFVSAADGTDVRLLVAGE